MSLSPGTGLKRRTPLKRSSFARSKRPKDWATKPRTPLKRKPLKKLSKSKRNSFKNRYFPARKEYLEKYPACQICLVRGESHPGRATEVHHARGRAGSLLWDSRFFVSSCRACREWPHENPSIARESGVLCEAHEWNVVPRDGAGISTAQGSEKYLR